MDKNLKNSLFVVFVEFVVTGNQKGNKTQSSQMIINSDDNDKTRRFITNITGREVL